MSNLLSNTSQLYRISYEAFSKFANDINRCKSLKEVGEVCTRHLKYLLNFRVIRIAMEQKGKYFVFEIAKNKIWYNIVENDALLDYENNLFENEIPIYTFEIPERLIKDKFDLTPMCNPVLWGWCFNKYDHKISVSLLADDEKMFATGDIDILNLVVDSIQAKFHELYLKKQLADRNKNLSEAYKTIKQKNHQIQSIVENQKEIITQRTKEIAQKNAKLLHISALNAHNVREPLSRIQGVIQLFALFDDESCRSELIPKLEQSVAEMDDVLKEVIQTATKELGHLKASEL
ncbi:histidine kinase [Gramella sp. AN32]|uniref:Histidine kinase n=1 Tax=Christiangramia antarctica TaxID=2058158 RepID=A0ABW5X7V6_9FLAO|nr:histidine kinase [Gramella sp. AN32]MCM4154497.1 histidine kinase [Gramella sp. AN32]